MQPGEEVPMFDEHKAEEVILFAKLILYGSEQTWSGAWTQREIDGFFYNQFLNDALQTAIREARLHSFGQEDAPYPCQWDSESAESEFVQPWGGIGSLDDLNEYFIGGNERQVALWNVGSAVNEIADRFGLQEKYLICSLVHGSPVPFRRLYAFGDYRSPVSFRVHIYALPFHSSERNWVESLYEDFRSWVRGFSEKHGPELMGMENWRAGANVQIDIKMDPLHIDVISSPPLVSPRILISLIQEAIALHKTEISGSTSTDTVIREWAVYLLSTLCGLKNREAIRHWNKELGDSRNLAYNMPDEVTNTGEQLFSREKAKLENRIERYQADSGQSLVSEIT